MTDTHPYPIAFTQNQRDELRDLGDLAATLNAEPGTHQQTYIIVPLTDIDGETHD